MTIARYELTGDMAFLLLMRALYDEHYLAGQHSRRCRFSFARLLAARARAPFLSFRDISSFFSEARALHYLEARLEIFYRGP